MHRRELMTRALAFGSLAALGATPAENAAPDQARSAVTTPRPSPIGVSTYSFWRFQDDWKLSIAECVSRAADMGFDFVEVLEMQMDRKDKPTLRAIKRIV